MTASLVTPAATSTGYLLRLARPCAPVGWDRLAGWLAASRRDGHPVVGWRLPDGRAVVGRGLALHATSTDPARWAWAGGETRRVRARLTGDAPAWLPLTWLGGSFGDDPPAGPWTGWPTAEVRIPRWLVHTGPEGAGVVGQVWVPGADEEPAALALLERGALALTTRLSQAPRPTVTAARHLRASLESQRSWERRVANAVAAIRRGELDKVVLARGVEHRLLDGWRWDAGACLTQLDREQPDAHVFAWSDPQARSTFVGATPELLGRTAGTAFDTVALAGTTPRDDDPARDAALGQALLDSRKDRHEHAITLQAIDAGLRPWARRLDVPTAPRLRRLPGLQHLETPIHAELERAGLLPELAQTLHPTPAVGGWPRAASRDWLASEPLERGWYAAPLGWLDAQGDGLLAVAIRSALLRGDRAWSFAGAGIVADSDPAAEWRETEAKLRAAERSLAALEETSA